MGPLGLALAGGAGGALIGAAGSLFSGKQSADFAENSFKHRYQWQVKDMQKAGLNPMLAFSQSPGSVPQPNFPNIGEGAMRGLEAGQKGYSAAQQARIMGEQYETQKATTNKTMGEAEALEIANTVAKADQKYRDAVDADPARGGSGVGATSAKMTQLEISQREAIIGSAKADIVNKGLEAKARRQDLDFKRDIQPLLVDEQKWINLAREKNMPELEAAAQYWSSLGMSGKVLETILDMVPGGEAIARVLMRRKVIVGRETSTTGPNGTTHRQESYDYR